jgi:hypothetical protein
MRVLVLESHPGVAADAVTQLSGAGHQIVSCEPDDGHAPCRGLAAHGTCPLDQPVDVAVLVQEVGVSGLPPGAVCAARDRVPVVEVDPIGVATRTPINGWTTASGSDLLAECTRAAADGRAHVQAIVDRLVTLAVVAPAEVRSAAPTIGFEVERGSDRLRLTIRVADAARERAGEIVRAATQALREFDRHAAIIDVAVRALPLRPDFITPRPAAPGSKVLFRR